MYKAFIQEALTLAPTAYAFLVPAVPVTTTYACAVPAAPVGSASYGYPAAAG